MPDQLATLRGLTKWAERIEHPAQAPPLVARAFQEMTSGRPGPAALEMPWERFTETAEARRSTRCRRIPRRRSTRTRWTARRG
jgi:acetolactate synthase-1/2/3 large subunit